MTTLAILIRLSPFILAFTVCAHACAADFVVIANPNSGIEKMSKDDVINIYMGRYRKLASGISAQPLDLTNPVSEKSKFYSSMVNKELPEINSYWARLMFSGQGSPPRQVDSVEEIIDIVSNNKGAIAYIDKKKVDKRVKVVFDATQ
ncbi:hypothetical protein ACO0K3_09195 [Undibacterium sp. Rencai35W]|uniref:hypothetical protein n=1 Tax=Undibacterium sp. Rencai35W TaxID=3413046 RepID=UPI003BF0D863